MSHRPLLLVVAIVLSLGMIPATYGLQSQPERDPFIEPAANKVDAGSEQIVEGSKVTLQYVATALGSTGIDYGNVSEFVQGRHEIFPALEREVVGMKPGEEKKVVSHVSTNTTRFCGHLPMDARGISHAQIICQTL